MSEFVDIFATVFFGALKIVSSFTVNRVKMTTFFYSSIYQGPYSVFHVLTFRTSSDFKEF